MQPWQDLYLNWKLKNDKASVLDLSSKWKMLNEECDENVSDE